jgi:hypothetical protein
MMMTTIEPIMPRCVSPGVYPIAVEQRCAECGCDLTEDEIASEAALCSACYQWHQDYADLDAED